MILFGKIVFTYSVVTQRDCIDFSIKNTETGGVRHYEISKVYNQLDNIVSSLMCDGVYWCAYNGRYHDETILNYCIINYNELKSKSVGDIAFLIDSFADTVHTHPVQDWINYKHARKFKSFDLAPLFYNRGVTSFVDAMFDTFGDSLKSEIDTPKGCFSDRRGYSRELSQTNANNYARLLDEKVIDVQFRELIETEYPLCVMNDNITSIGMKLFKLFYSEKTEFIPVNNKYTSIRIDDLISTDYSFKSAGNNAFLSELKNTEINQNSTLSVVLPGKIASFTAGGLKGFKDKGVFTGNHIYYVDFKSAWPNMVVNFGITPVGLQKDAFVYAIDKIKSLRNRYYDKQFKLAVNSVIGNLMVENSEIHDYKAFMAIKVMSTLETVSLIEALGDSDILQINNDGVVFVSDRPKNSIRMELGEWEEKHKISLNFKEYKLFCQYSINDWFAVDTNSEIISSGFFKYGSAKYPLASAEAVKISITDNLIIDNAMSLVSNDKYVIRKKAGANKEFVIKDDGMFTPIGSNVTYTICKKGRGLYVIGDDMSNPKSICISVVLGKASYKDIDTMSYIKIAYQLLSELVTKQLKLF